MKSPIGSSSPCNVQASGAIELLFYGELAGAERARVERHVSSCPECRRAFDDLVTIREALASRPDIASPPGGDWARFMARLDDAVRRERWVGPMAPDASSSVRGLLRHGRPRGRAYAYLATAALLTLVTIAVLLVARQREDVTGSVSGSHVRPAAVESVPTPPEAGGDAALTSVSEQHFERSKLVVLGLATKDPGDGPGSNWEYEQELASALLDDTRLYRMAAEQRGMQPLAGVMRDLELLLLEASMTEQPDGESLETLQRLIRRRDLLTKMEVVRTTGL